MPSYTAPSCSGKVDIYLSGTTFTAPNYPDCPSENVRRKIGQCDGGQTVELVYTVYPYGCRNAAFVNVSGITNDYQSQWSNGTCSLDFVCNPDASKYDCLNGNCVKNDQYKTPGIHQSLDDCKTVCGSSGVCGDGKICIDPNNYCPNGKVCLDQSEVSQINSLIGKISGEVC